MKKGGCYIWKYESSFFLNFHLSPQDGTIIITFFFFFFYFEHQGQLNDMEGRSKTSIIKSRPIHIHRVAALVIVNGQADSALILFRRMDCPTAVGGLNHYE